MSNKDETLPKSYPSTYMATTAKALEANLQFEDAAKMYVAAYNSARKEKLATTIKYKWAAMRCIEMKDIHKRLKEKLHSSGAGLVEGDVVTVYWHQVHKIVPKEVWTKVTLAVPSTFSYQVVRYNTKTQTVELLQCLEFFQSAEPKINKVTAVHKDGTVVELPKKDDPDIILHKWALVDSNYSVVDVKANLRRSIKIEYLKIPEWCKSKMTSHDFFTKNIAPYIGNRNIGRFLKSKVDG